MKSAPDTVLKCNFKDSDGFKEDYEFYLNLRKRMDPVIGYNIPGMVYELSVSCNKLLNINKNVAKILRLLNLSSPHQIILDL